MPSNPWNASCKSGSHRHRDQRSGKDTVCTKELCLNMCAYVCVRVLTCVCASLWQISESVFSLQSEDGSLVPHDKQVQEAGLFLRCVPAPDPQHRKGSCCNIPWSWRIRDGRLETRDWCLFFFFLPLLLSINLTFIFFLHRSNVVSSSYLSVFPYLFIRPMYYFTSAQLCQCV